MIWKRQISLDTLNQMTLNSMIGHLSITFTQLHNETIEAVMPVNQQTMQPFGLLHGGASVTLAETLGSVAGYLCSEGNDKVVGLEINASHLKAVRQGHVRGVCKALRLGKRHHVWQIELFDDDDNLCCISRLTTAILSDKGR